MNITDLLGNNKGSEGRSMSGVVPGTIVGTFDLMQMGRVQILIPSISMKFVSNWARVATPMAGNQCGAFFRPEVGDEVLVAFENGDINRPYVIGSLWNGKMMPPVPDYNPHVLELRSRSFELPPPPVGLSGPAAMARNEAEDAVITGSDAAMEGEEEALSADEEPSQAAEAEGEAEAEAMEATAEVENVAESTGGMGHVIRLNSSEGTAKIQIIDQTGANMITIDSETNTILIESAMNLEFNAPNGELILNGASVVINAATEINLNSDVGVNISSAEVLLDTEEGVNIVAGGEVSVDAGGEMNLAAGAALNAEAAAELGLTAGAALNAQAAAEMGMKAGAALNVTAGAELGLKAGAELSAAAGAEVSIAAGAAMSLDASVDVNIMGAMVNING